MDSERRQTTRIPARVSVHLETLERPDKLYSQTITKNIGEGGAQILSDRFYAPRSKFLLRMNAADLGKTIEALAEVVWASHLPFSDRYALGLRFTEISQQHQKFLHDYIMIKETTSSPTKG